MVVLLEFQSRVDRYMALRVQSAAIRIYEHLLQEDKEFRWTRYLAPILPIVMQNGSGRWTAPTCMRDLVRPRTLPAGHIVSLMIRTENIQGLDGAIPVPAKFQSRRARSQAGSCGSELSPEPVR